MPRELHRDGERTYLDARERLRFLAAARRNDPEVRTLCDVLAATGCRISEVLALTATDIDLTTRRIALQHGRTGVARELRVSAAAIVALERTHGIRKAQRDRERAAMRLWPWSRKTAWERVREVMEAAGIDGVRATPRGLRHGAAVAAVRAGVSLQRVQHQLGHRNDVSINRYRNKCVYDT